ncbi:MAG: hypothetical protein HY909_13390 [Deltaproteobacteria bacterium]|nr:hypothetical protein [Deltaproteobacteria bacterium]
MKTWSLLALSVALLGCGATQGWRVPTNTPRPARSGGVVIYRMGDALPARFTELGLVQAQGVGTHADLEHLYEGLTEEAQALGADAVVRVEVNVGATQAWAAGVAVRTGEGPPGPAASTPQGEGEEPGASAGGGVAPPWGRR